MSLERNINRHLTYEVGEPPRGWRLTALAPAPEKESEEWVWLHGIGPKSEMETLAVEYREMDLPFVVLDENPPGWECRGAYDCVVNLGDIVVRLGPDE